MKGDCAHGEIMQNYTMQNLYAILINTKILLNNINKIKVFWNNIKNYN